MSTFTPLQTHYHYITDMQGVMHTRELKPSEVDIFYDALLAFWHIDIQGYEGTD